MRTKRTKTKKKGRSDKKRMKRAISKKKNCAGDKGGPGEKVPTGWVGGD